MEHLNRTCETAVAHLGANLTPKAIVCIGKCIGLLTNLCSSFDLSTGVTCRSGAHSDAAQNADIAKIVSELIEKVPCLNVAQDANTTHFRNLVVVCWTVWIKRNC